MNSCEAAAVNNTEIPVLVVGGGAAGTMLSLELARHGVTARTVDRLSKPASTSKAITIHARMAEIFERIDTRLIERYLARAIRNKGYILHLVDDAGIRREVRPGIDFTGLESKYPWILVHSQSETEQALRDYLLEEYGRSTQWGVNCTSVEHRNDGVLATLEHADGSLEQVHCQYLIACDGMNSRIRRTLGLVQDESDYAGTKMQNLDVVLHGFPDVEDYVHYCAGTDHFIMIVKLPGGYFRLLLSDRGEAADPGVTPQRAFLNLVDRHFDGVRLGHVIWHSKWESWVRLAKTYRDRNVFLAGDSAHVHSTTGGQGMNCCMQDAWNLGWKLALVLAGRASPTLLDTYERERRPIAEQVIWAASSLHEIFMGHGKGIDERTQRISDNEFLDAVVGHCSGLSYTYSEVLAHGDDDILPGPAIGDRATAIDFDADAGVFMPKSASRYLLAGLTGSSGDTADTERAVRQLEERFPAVLDVRTVVAGEALKRRCGESSQLILVRPDGYIGGRCLTEHADRLTERLSAELGLASGA
jgi:NADPH-dependent dioxygenase